MICHKQASQREKEKGADSEIWTMASNGTVQD